MNLTKGLRVADEPNDVATVIPFPRPKFGQEEQTSTLTVEEVEGWTLEQALAFADTFPDTEAALPPW